MITLINGLLFIILGLIALFKNFQYKILFIKIKNSRNYEKTIGTVICNAYSNSDLNTLERSITPIVEFEVEGVKYEAVNRSVGTHNELPEGTKLYLWYKKDDPNDAWLPTDVAGTSFVLTIIGFGCIFAGLLEIL